MVRGLVEVRREAKTQLERLEMTETEIATHNNNRKLIRPQVSFYNWDIT